LKTGWVKTGRSVQEANKSKKGRGRESEVRAGRVRTGRSGIYSNNTGELGTKTQDNLAEDKWK